MAVIKIIAAVGENNELGKNNELIWHLKGDMKFFKEQTINHKIIMGYKTFLSLKRLLPDREHIVLTHHNLEEKEVVVFHDFNTLLSYLNGISDDVYVIGGASIYRLFLEYAQELILTRVYAKCEDADAYFPEFNEYAYDKELLGEGAENDIRYHFTRYRRK